jgi:hypothetical protein
VDYAQQLTSAPRIYHLAVGFTLAGAVLRRNVWAPFQDDAIYPNLWACLLGDSGATSKSTAINLGVRCLPARGDGLLYPSNFSIQHLVSTMQARPQGLLVYREFKHLSDLLQRDYMRGATAMLTDVYDCPAQIEAGTQERGVEVVKDPALSILAASTPEWWAGRKTQAEVASGWLARFLFVPAGAHEAGAPNPWPQATPELLRDRDNLRAQLQIAAEQRGPVVFRAHDKAAYGEWFRWHQRQSPFLGGPFSAFVRRFEVLAVKLTLIAHVSGMREVSDPLDATTVPLCCALVDHLEGRLWTYLSEGVAFTPHQEARARALRAIPNGGAEVTQRDLLRGLRVPLRDFLAVMETLLAEGQVSRRVERVRGEAKTWWSRLN